MHLDVNTRQQSNILPTIGPTAVYGKIVMLLMFDDVIWLPCLVNCFDFEPSIIVCGFQFRNYIVWSVSLMKFGIWGVKYFVGMLGLMP